MFAKVQITTALDSNMNPSWLNFDNGTPTTYNDAPASCSTDREGRKGFTMQIHSFLRPLASIHARRSLYSYANGFLCFRVISARFSRPFKVNPQSSAFPLLSAVQFSMPIGERKEKRSTRVEKSEEIWEFFLTLIYRSYDFHFCRFPSSFVDRKFMKIPLNTLA